MKNLSYDQAMAQLKIIVSELQKEELALDLLTEKIKEAKDLIAFCSNKLRSTEEELSQLFDEEE